MLLTPARSRLVTGLLLAIGAVLVVWRLHTVFSAPILPGQPWQTSSPYLGDFRDLIYGPGRFLLAGGNVYDPDAYTAATPGSAEFDPYAPAWLLLSVLFCWMPYLTGGLLYEIFGLCVLGVFAAVIVRLAGIPRPLLSTLALFAFFVLWYPTRSAASGSSLIVALGVLLAVGYLRTRPWLASCGVALALIKPQFGLPVAILLLAARGTVVVGRGVVLIAAASLPFLVWCVGNAGGVAAFADALLRDIAFASSSTAATGLGSPQQFRIDVLGIIARVTGAVPPGWFQVVVPIVMVAVAAVLLRATRCSILRWVLVATTSLLGLVHLPYDLPLIAGPAVIGTAYLVRDRAARTPFTVAATAALLLILVHVHAVDQFLFPHAPAAWFDAVDSFLLMASWVAAVVAGVRHEHDGLSCDDAAGADGFRPVPASDSGDATMDDATDRPT